MACRAPRKMGARLRPSLSIYVISLLIKESSCQLQRKCYVGGMLLLRIEREDGRGPYIPIKIFGRNLAGFKCCRPSQKWPLPGFRTLMKIDEWKSKGSSFRYSFPSVKDLTNWFSWTQRKRMGNRGFRISVYKVPMTDVLIDNGQSVFRLDVAEFMKAIPLPSTAKEMQKILAEIYTQP